MFKFLRKHRTVLMVTLAACIIGLPFFGIGGSSLMSSPQDTIAKVNGKKLTQYQFDQLYNQILRTQQDMKPEQRNRLANEVFNELVRQEAFYQEAKRYGIIVSDQELQMNLASMPAFQKDGQFDGFTYMQTVTQVFGMTPDDFEEMRRKDIAGRKLNSLIASSIHVDEEAFKLAYAQRLNIETDPEVKKGLIENPDGFRNEIRNQEVNRVFADWLAALNSSLKVSIISENFRKRLSGQS